MLRLSGDPQLLSFSWSEAGATGFEEIGTEVFQVPVVSMVCSVSPLRFSVFFCRGYG